MLILSRRRRQLVTCRLCFGNFSLHTPSNPLERASCPGIVWSTGTTRGRICSRKIPLCGLRQLSSGTGPDALQYPELGKLYNYKAYGVVLRLRSAIRDKSVKLHGYIADGFIKPGQATVIAISGVSLPHRYSGIVPPEIVRAVYPANNPAIEINLKTMAVSDRYTEYRDRVKKSRGAEVATDVFLDSEFEHIGAVLYGEAGWVEPSNPPGSDFRIVHNSRAVTPLPDGWFPAGDEYWSRDGARLEGPRHE
jgi:hypothetical protein